MGRNAIRQVDANGAVTLSSYDPLGREIRTTNPVSGTTVMTYNATEKVAEQDPQGNVTWYAYDGAGRLRQEVDPTGSVTQDGYDPVGNTTAITTGDRNTIIQVDTRQYDALNRVMTDTVSGPTTPAQETLTWYDLDGNRAMVQNPNGDSTVYNYDLADQLIDVNITDVTASTATNDQNMRNIATTRPGIRCSPRTLMGARPRQRSTETTESPTALM
jgi:YD repeat-containing protein